MGLGGTGKEVLLRLRKILWSKLGGQLDNWPTLGFLWLDSDTERNYISGYAQEDFFVKSVKFRPDEIVDLKMSSEQLAQYFSAPKNYPNVSSWLPVDELQGIHNEALMTGARHVRPLGRLQFFHHFGRIRSEIEKKLGSIRESESVKKARENGFDCLSAGEADIVIVCSLAGGTGSGMFLDVAFLAKCLRESQLFNIQEIVLYLMMPDVITECKQAAVGDTVAKTSLLANGYGSLSELEFYSQPPKDGDAKRTTKGPTAGYFHPVWDQATGYPNKPIKGPPFSVCYLIGNGGKQPVNSSFEVSQMVADCLYLECAGSTLAAAKRAIRANQAIGLMGMWHPSGSARASVQEFSRRYSSCGLAKVATCRDELCRIASYLLSARLLESELGTSRSGESRVEEALSALKLGGNNIPRFVSKEESRVRDFSSTFSSEDLAAELVVKQGDIRRFLTKMAADDRVIGRAVPEDQIDKSTSAIATMAEGVRNDLGVASAVAWRMALKGRLLGKARELTTVGQSLLVPSWEDLDFKDIVDKLDDLAQSFRKVYGALQHEKDRLRSAQSIGFFRFRSVATSIVSVNIKAKQREVNEAGVLLMEQWTKASQAYMDRFFSQFNGLVTAKLCSLLADGIEDETRREKD
ncbi:MAG: tubulin-like doman-containing protein, partial [Candidatus Brocadiia bacterium]